jgi:glycosyltransferase involved in cell wall biosynthesis
MPARASVLDRIGRLLRRDTRPDHHRVYLLMTNAYGHGGVARTTLKLAGHLAQRGHDVEVISLFRRADEPFFPIDDRVRVTVLEDQRSTGGQNRRAADDPSRSVLARKLDAKPTRLLSEEFEDSRGSSLLTDLKLRRKLRSLRPGVVIATRPPLTVAAARWSPRHVLTTSQEHISYKGRQKVVRTALREVAPALDAFLTLTEEDRQTWMDVLGEDAPLVVAIPNASPFEVGDPAPLTSKIVMAAGRLSSQKGFDRLIPAFAPVARAHPDWRLHIYGSGPMRGRLAKLVREHDLDGSVELMGLVNGLEDAFANASVYAMSSRYEGLPMVLLEAMAKGVPMVSFDCPHGPRQLIRDGENGLLVPDGDVEALTAALLEMVEDEEKRMRLGAGALKSAFEYEPGAITDRWEALFEELVRRRGA